MPEWKDLTFFHLIGITSIILLATILLWNRQTEDVNSQQSSENLTPAAAAAARKKMVRILCFGDSLTEGFYHHGLKFHPYATRLTKLLNDSKPGYYPLVLPWSPVSLS